MEITQVLVASFGLLLASASNSDAGAVFVDNFSFENPGGGGGDYPAATSWSGSSFTEISSGIGLTGGTGPRHAAQDPGITMSQDLGIVLLPNTIYTLTVALANRTSEPLAPTGFARFGLTVSGTELGIFSNINVPALVAAQTFQDFTYTFTTGATVPGGNVGIALGAIVGGRSLYDNVRLDSTTPIIPPPIATVTLSTTAPLFDGDDITQLLTGTQATNNLDYGGDMGPDNANYIASDRPAQGQTFTTAVAGRITSVTIKTTTGGADTPSALTLRINTAAGSTLSEIRKEAAAFPIAGLVGNDYVTFTLATPLLISAGTYGFDFVVPTGYFQVDGAPNSSYAGGISYSSGAKNGVGTTTADFRDTDRTFGIAFSPEIAIALVIKSSSFNFTTDQLSLTWTSQATRTYKVTTSPDLFNWSTVLQSGIAGQAGETSTTVGFTQGTKAFFRVEQE